MWTPTRWIFWWTHTIRPNVIALVRLLLWISLFLRFTIALFVQKAITSWIVSCSTLRTIPTTETLSLRFPTKISNVFFLNKSTNIFRNRSTYTIWIFWLHSTLRTCLAWQREIFSTGVSASIIYSRIGSVERWVAFGSVAAVRIPEAVLWVQLENKSVNGFLRKRSFDCFMKHALTPYHYQNSIF